MGKDQKRTPLIKWQTPNKRVLYALIPAVIASIYFFGWRSLFLLCIVTVFGFITELCFVKTYYKEPVTSAVFVTSVLFALTLPPTIPYWIAVIGIVFGVAIGKMAFGGFGRNIFNPALTGRAFIYISFGAFMTSSWVEPLGGGFPGGFGVLATDAVTRATPLGTGADSYISLLLGNISGSLGETSAILILIGGMYLILKKTASYRIVLSGFIGMLILHTALWVFNVNGALDPLRALLSGGWMLGIFFMATDPVSAAQTNAGRWLYGGLVGAISAIIRIFSIWSEGVMFAILLGNMFNPIIDYYIKQWKSGRSGT
ncbi:MAG: RnfABCDGE type electron transport complex subunit D [Spirochaetota bacterium]|nr:MAG: RnfABCDGE type electron transport complex subunit D [Spirochaetota bacterium]